MKNINIYNEWTNFINNSKYKNYFASNEYYWFQTLNELINYINTNNKTPSKGSENTIERKLGGWLSLQKRKYKSKKQIMSNQNIYNEWTNFINNKKYKKYFLTNNEI